MAWLVAGWGLAGLFGIVGIWNLKKMFWGRFIMRLGDVISEMVGRCGALFVSKHHGWQTMVIRLS